MLRMRTILKLDDDALLIVKQYARRERCSLGAAVSRLIFQASQVPADASKPLRGRFALLPARNEVITCEHVRALLDDKPFVKLGTSLSARQSLNDPSRAHHPTEDPGARRPALLACADSCGTHRGR
jgi:hypothetical protein